MAFGFKGALQLVFRMNSSISVPWKHWNVLFNPINGFLTFGSWYFKQCGLSDRETIAVHSRLSLRASNIWWKPCCFGKGTGMLGNLISCSSKHCWICLDPTVKDTMKGMKLMGSITVSLMRLIVKISGFCLNSAGWVRDEWDVFCSSITLHDNVQRSSSYSSFSQE